MTRRKPKFKNALADFMVQDGLQPLDVLMAGIRYHLHHGDVQSALAAAQAAAPFRHAKLQAVAVGMQGSLFLTEDGNLTLTSDPLLAKTAPKVSICWDDNDQLENVLATKQQAADTEEREAERAARRARIAALDRQIEQAEQEATTTEKVQQSPPEGQTP